MPERNPNIQLTSFFPCLTFSNNKDHIFYFITVITCPKKCNFRIDGFNNRRYSLESIILEIGNEIRKVYSCSGPEFNRNLYINCSSWNASKSHIFNWIIRMNNKAVKGITLLVTMSQSTI